MKVIFNRIVNFSLALLLCVGIALCGFGGGSAYAETSVGIQAEYERTDALADLRGATIAGKEFDVTNYPHNENSSPQLLSFVEFCYSYYSNKQSDYGLYVYVYNPQDLVFDTTDKFSKIQLTYGNEERYVKYPLTFINYSKSDGYEGRFWKFKVKLTEEQKEAVLKSVNENGRVYKISGMELCANNVVKDYPCAQTYTYKGYAFGYGSELAQADTLSCTVDGYDTVVELNVNQTVYRAKGDYYNGEQSQLNSCYFRVPNKFFTDYGELTEIACEWYEYFTKPILVTEDNVTYSKINGLHGKNTDTLPDDTYFLFNVFWENSKTSWFSKSGISDWTSNYGYKVGDSYHWGFLWLNGTEVIYDSFDNFAAAFYTGGGNCEDYCVDGAELKSKLLENSKVLGEPYIHGRYSKALFEDYVQAGRKYGYNYKAIKATDKMDVFWNYTTKSLWQKMFAGEIDVDTVYESLNAIVTVKDADIKGSNGEIAERLKIAEKDVDKLKAECAAAKAQDETVVLLRYSSNKYFSAPCVSSYCSKSKVDGGKTPVKTNVEKWGNNDFNAYVCQETVYLDFDIISLTYTNNGVSTVIGVVSSPEDVISSISPPLEDPFANDGLSGWQILLLVLGLILILILLFKFAPAIVYALVKVIALPFKALGKLFSSIRSSAKAKREQGRQKQPKPAKGKKSEKFDREAIEKSLDEIDWDDPMWQEIDGSDG